MAEWIPDGRGGKILQISDALYAGVWQAVQGHCFYVVWQAAKWTNEAPQFRIADYGNSRTERQAMKNAEHAVGNAAPSSESG